MATHKASDVPFMGHKSFWRDGAWKPLAWDHDPDGVGYCVSLYPARMINDTHPDAVAGLFVDIEAHDGATQAHGTTVHIPLLPDGPLREVASR